MIKLEVILADYNTDGRIMELFDRQITKILDINSTKGV